LSQSIIIRAIETKQDLRKFINFPYALYKKSETWVPPLLITQKQLFNKNHLFWKKNPHQFFLAFKGTKCVGRIAAFINQEHNTFFKKQDGFFGFLEAENDFNIFRLLLQEAEDFTAKFNCEQIIGPMNPTIHDELGILVKGFEFPPYFMLTHNFNYYDKFILSNGFLKLKDFYSYKLKSAQYQPSEKMIRVGTMIKTKHNIRIREAKMKDYFAELQILHSIYNDAFRDHWGFVPIKKEAFQLLAKDMKVIIDPRMVLIAEIDENPIAFLLCLPNLNEILIKIKNGRLFPFGIFKILLARKKLKSARIITVAVKKAYQHLGLGSLMYPEIMQRGLQYNYSDCELSWVVDDNLVMNQLAKHIGAEPYKTYRLYTKLVD